MNQLTNPIAKAFLSHWDIPSNASLRLINVSENETFLIESKVYKTILRLHRFGYHTKRAIECELEWSAALRRDTGIQTPLVIAGRDGALIQTVTPDGLPPHHAVLFEFIEGDHPSEDQDLVPAFYNLGALAAKTHLHSINWERSDDFERLNWDLDSVFGPNANWGDWRNAPNVTNDIRRILERVERVIIHRLNAFSRRADRYGLIHADMRLANLLIKDDDTRLIDFDDCGFGWFLYDFAAAISFMEDHPNIPELRAAWVKGYRAHREISGFEEAELDSFVMLRRMALLAWIGTHMDSTEPQALAPDFARTTAKLSQKYLAIM